jgi:hypothetical protein
MERMAAGGGMAAVSFGGVVWRRFPVSNQWGKVSKEAPEEGKKRSTKSGRRCTLAWPGFAKNCGEVAELWWEILGSLGAPWSY